MHSKFVDRQPEDHLLRGRARQYLAPPLPGDSNRGRQTNPPRPLLARAVAAAFAWAQRSFTPNITKDVQWLLVSDAVEDSLSSHLGLLVSAWFVFCFTLSAPRLGLFKAEGKARCGGATIVPSRGSRKPGHVEPRHLPLAASTRKSTSC
jgi:hypothetical protein